MGTDRLIYIRTDGNSKIATGHLVRCLSIADACLNAGLEVCFLVSDKESEKLLQSFDTNHKFPVLILKTAAYDNLEKELPEVLALLSSGKQKSYAVYDTNVTNKNIVYLLDSYYVTENYLYAIKALVPTAYLDDLQLFDYPAELIINYDVIPESMMPVYQKSYQNAAHTLLGASYTPLRSQFTDKKAALRNCVSDILITTGGSDPYHFSLKLMEAFQEKLIPAVPFQLQIVIGRLSKDRDMLHQLAGELPFIHLHENVSDMASLMEGCDLAISAAGTTLYELCAVGIPSISYTMADNQITAATAFAEAKAIPYAGDIRTSQNSVINSIIDFVTYMSENFEKRKSAHENMSRLVDGKGALRIAGALSEL